MTTDLRSQTAFSSTSENCHQQKRTRMDWIRQPAQLLMIAFTVVSCGTIAADEPHSHSPIVVYSRPVIERLPVKVAAPVDVEISAFGDTIIADRIGKMVLCVDPTGESHVLAKGFDQILRVVDAPVFGVHVLCGQAESSIVFRCLDSGVSAEFAHLPFTAIGFGADPVGNLFTANQRTGEIFRIDSEGSVRRMARVSEPVKDLTCDSIGNAIVLLRSGKVVSVGTDGSSETVGYVPETSARIRIHPDRLVLALGAAVGRGATIYKTTVQQDETEVHARVPEGTIAFAFDALGNLTLSNSDLRAVTRATSHFQVPCPHCGQLVPMTLTTDALPADAPGTRIRRSF